MGERKPLRRQQDGHQQEFKSKPGLAAFVHALQSSIGNGAISTAGSGIEPVRQLPRDVA